MTEISSELPEAASRHQKEYRRLELLAGKDFKVSSVGTVGYVVHNLKRQPNSEGDWILIDIDDTLVDISQAKSVRDSRIKELIGIADDTESIRLFEETDKLARFMNPGAPADSYHIRTHESLLSIYLRQKRAGKSTDEIREALRSHAKEWANGQQPYVANDEVKNFFKETMFKPEVYTHGLTALRELSERQRSSAYAPNVAFLTYGEADNQLYKALQLAQICDINSIWLTQVPKGEFLRELITSDPNAYNGVETRAVAPNIRSSSEGEDTSDDVGVSGLEPKAWGINFKNSDRILVLFDDSPDEIKSLKDGLADLKGAKVVPVAIRIKRAGTKNYQKELELEGIELPTETIHSPLTETPVLETLPNTDDFAVAYNVEVLKRFRSKENVLAQAKFRAAEFFLKSHGYDTSKILEG